MVADPQGQQNQSLGARLGWFALLWLAGVTAVGAVSLVIKWALR